MDEANEMSTEKQHIYLINVCQKLFEYIDLKNQIKIDIEEL